MKTERDETIELLVRESIERTDMGRGQGRRGETFPSGLSASLFFPRPGNDLPARSARPTGLRGHGHGRCDSDPRVLFGGRRADKPLKGPVSPSSKVYQLLSGYTSRITTTVAAIHIGRNTSTLPLYLYSNHSSSCILHVPIDKRPFYIPALGMEEIIV